MPELPEVEAFTKYFNRTSLHKKIDTVSKPQLNSVLADKEFNKAYRRGKFLIAFVKNSDYKIVFHFGMTGWLKYVAQNSLTKKDIQYARAIFTFHNNYQLLYIDPRRFGKIYAVKDLNKISTLKKMGPEALKISKNDFLALLETKKRKNIKAFLMNQHDIAGIGNDYSNEILFQAAINPKTTLQMLSTPQQNKLYLMMYKVLKKAILLNEHDEAYPKSWLLAHKYSDMKCPKNKQHSLKRSTIAGRSAIYCPEHQK